VSKSSQKTTPVERRQPPQGGHIRARKVQPQPSQSQPSQSQPGQPQSGTTGKTVPVAINKAFATKPAVKLNNQEPTSRVKRVVNSSSRPTAKSNVSEINSQRAARSQPTVPENTSRVRTRVATATKKGDARVVKDVKKGVKDSNGKIPPFKPAITPTSFKTVKTRRRKEQKSHKSQNRINYIRKTSPTPMARTLLYALRLLIIGVGIGAIVGTMLSILDPATRLNSAGISPNIIASESDSQKNSSQTKAYGLSLSTEITTLKTRLENLVSEYPSMTPGVLFVDIESGAYADINASETFSAASTIKFPILVAFFQDVDAGKIRLDEVLTMEKKMMVGGSGDMQNQPVGTKYKALEVADKMMTISDNTATNMLIARLGGMEVLNQRFRSWGLTVTQLNNWLPDIKGTNTTTPKELANLITILHQGNLVTTRSRDRIFEIMLRNERRHLLPAGLGEGATIAHKTGNIGSMVGDVGLVNLPSGRQYIAATLIKRPRNDESAEKLIRSISRAGYREFNNSNPTNTTNSTDSTGNTGNTNSAPSTNQTDTTPSPTPTSSATPSTVPTPTPNTAPAPASAPAPVNRTAPVPSFTPTAPIPTINTPSIPRTPTTNFQPPVIRPLPNPNAGVPYNTYQPPVMNPVPVNPYQPPAMNPGVPGAAGAAPPYGTYQPPVWTPQYYPPR
jgi:beta-lactamase class A